MLGPRLREEGHVYFGEVFLVPSDETNQVEKLEQAHEEVHDLDWRLHDVVITPTRELGDREGQKPQG
jgi:hypothetical protein